MEYFFFESPYTLGAVALVLIGIAWYAFLQSGERVAGYVAAGITLLGVVLVIMNCMVVTDRERVTDFIMKTAKELDDGNTEYVLEIIHPNSLGNLKSTIATYLPRLRLDEARVTRIHSIEIDSSEFPKTAQVRMNVFVKGTVGEFQFNAPRWMLLDLTEDTSSGKPRWLVMYFEHRDAHHEFMGSDIER